MNESALDDRSTLTADPRGRMVTFRSTGWVFLLAALIAIGILAYVIVHTISRGGFRPPGDGRTIESYLFSLSPTTIPVDQITRGHPVRDLFPAMTDPPTMRGDEMASENARTRKAYLVPDDRIVGVEINGEARAYPISVLNCHEIVNDTLGGAPIVVTYNMLCDSVVVFDRRPVAESQDRESAAGAIEFGVSGLLYKSNLLMYGRKGTAPRSDSGDEQIRTGGTPVPPVAGGESLWSQLLCKAVTGPASEAGLRLRVLPMAVTTWAAWLERHPETTVIRRDPSRTECYRDSATFASRYFNERSLRIPVGSQAGAGAAGDRPPKSRIAAVTIDGQRRIYDLADLANRADESGAATDELAGLPLRLTCTWNPRTNIPTFAAAVNSEAAPGRAGTPEVEVIYAFWFAWHAMWPQEVPGR